MPSIPLDQVVISFNPVYKGGNYAHSVKDIKYLKVELNQIDHD